MLVIFWLPLLIYTFLKDVTEAKNHSCIFKEVKVLVCKKHLPKIQYPSNVTTLELYDIGWDNIDFNRILEKFPEVENLTVQGPFVEEIFPPLKSNKVKVLQLKDLKVSKVTKSFVKKFPMLDTLHLDGNHLQSLSKEIMSTNIKHLYLSDNKWNCSKDLDWVLRLDEKRVPDLHNITCHGDPYIGKPLVPIAEFLKETKLGCPSKCNCSLDQVVRDLSDQLDPIIEVNCSRRGFTNLPNKFPFHTRILHLEGNYIEDLSPLKEKAVYKGVSDIYLDNNRISSIEELEGGIWLRHFRVFSLSGNRLTEVPSYALDNALQHNLNMPNAVRIKLGGNPWRCDCVFTSEFQKFLQKYELQIGDLEDIKCSYMEGDENSLLPIVDLSRSSICRSSEYSLQEALDLLNAVLALLIIFILGKLAYDYYHFKKSGKLPWIVTKMP